MMINKAYIFRIYPNKAQETLINKTIGCSSFAFHYSLSLGYNAYKETGKVFTYSTCSAKLPAMKKEFVWLKEVKWPGPYSKKLACKGYFACHFFYIYLFLEVSQRKVYIFLYYVFLSSMAIGYGYDYFFFGPLGIATIYLFSICMVNPPYRWRIHHAYNWILELLITIIDGVFLIFSE